MDRSEIIPVVPSSCPLGQSLSQNNKSNKNQRKGNKSSGSGMGCWRMSTLFSVLLFPGHLLLLLLLTNPVAGQEDVLMDPCEFTRENFVHCQCGPYGDLLKVEQAKCGIFGDAKTSSAEWDAIGRLENLQTLEFNVRPVRQLKFFIPDNVFSRMSTLSYFVLKMADVERMPSFAFVNSSTVREITLETNEIRYLSSNSFAHLTSLKTLSLGDNLILEVNRNVFVQLPQLQQLYLDRNHIGVIHDKAFKDLGALEELYVHNNNLTVIARDAFMGLKKLRRLDLRINFIEFLGDHVFAEMPLLEDVDLTSNKIISVSPTAFAGLKELGRLILKENKIVKLDSRTFESLQKIYFLDLRSNELETLEEELISPIYPNLRNVSTQLMVEGNRFVCDCRILWIQELCNETDSYSIQYELNRTKCNFFQRHRSHSSQPHRMRQGQKGNHHGGNNNNNHGGHSNSNMEGLSYNSKLTVLTVAPEETTSFAEFDSIRNVMELDPREMDCDESKVTTLMSVSTHAPPTSSDVLHLAPPVTESPVLVKRKKNSQKHAGNWNENGSGSGSGNGNGGHNQFLSDHPDPELNPSQSSRSASASSTSSASRAALTTMVRVTTWLSGLVTILSLPCFLSLSFRSA